VTATCLGCGLACDDIRVTVKNGRIAEAGNACTLGVQWFGTGQVPSRARIRGADADRMAALAEAARILTSAKRPLVSLGADLSTDAQRAACELADVLGALIDTMTPAAGILATQERGRCSATLGEIRHGADVVVLWHLDPDNTYPRLRSRYLPGLHFISVDDVDAALARAAVLGHASNPQAKALADRLTAAKYVAIIVDGETRSGDIEALLALTEALNGPTRAALVILRRVGAESVLTWQTGYPKAIDFARGYPRYVPYDRHEFDAALIVGSGTTFDGVPTIVIGPRASEAMSPASVALDTGVAGIHDGGAAVRTDDITVPLRPPLPGTVPETAATVRELTALVRRS
jgi:formylmethanofuran dehydrogenase subunit B